MRHLLVVVIALHAIEPSAAGIEILGPRPRFVLTAEQKRSAAFEAVGVAVGVGLEVSPLAPEYAVAKKISDIAIDGSIASVESRNALVTSDLRTVDKDTARLCEMVRAGKSLSDDPDARAVVSRLKERMRQNESAWSFFGRSVASEHALYDFAIVAGMTFIHLPEGLGKGVNAPVREAYRDAFQSSIRRSGWKALKDHARLAGNASQKLVEELIEVALDKAVKDGLKDWLREKMDAWYEAALHEAPSGGTQVDPSDLRLVIAMEPQLVEPVLARPVMIPMVVAAPPAAVAAIAQPAVVARAAVPAIAIAHADPVVRTVITDNASTAMTMTTAGSRPSSEAKSEPDSEPAPTPAPVRAPITVHMPNICGQSWSGNGISVCR